MFPKIKNKKNKQTKHLFKNRGSVGQCQHEKKLQAEHVVAQITEQLRSGERSGRLLASDGTGLAEERVVQCGLLAPGQVQAINTTCPTSMIVFKSNIS